ncbi:MAG: recombinase family protein [Bacillota bacterium]
MKNSIIKKEKNNQSFSEKSIYNKNKLKVCAYCRVSTIERESSINTQIIYYTNYIRSNPNYNFIGIFSDRGISGTNVKRRPGFERMIRKAVDDEIDLILCKSISRFGRNLVNVLSYLSILKEHNVRVIFEKENIDTKDLKNDIFIQILSILSQEESNNISMNIKWSIEKRFQRGEPIFNRLLGYKLDDEKNWIIIFKEAEIIKEAYTKFIDGKLPSEIAADFTTKGYKKINGRTDWGALTIRNILKNERYVGDALCRKTFTKDFITHKVLVNRGEKNRYLITDHHASIIDREIFKKVQELLNKRRKYRKNIIRKTYPFSKRITCKKCGGNFQRYKLRDKVYWRCGNHLKNKALCKTTGIKEIEIFEAVSKAFIQKYKLNNFISAKHKIMYIEKELNSVLKRREFEEKQIFIDLEKLLLEENIAIIQNNSKHLEKSTLKRKKLENLIVKKEKYWEMLDNDVVYHEKAKKIIEKLKRVDNMPKEYLKSDEFLRAFVIKIEIDFPNKYKITWINDDISSYKDKGDI